MRTPSDRAMSGAAWIGTDERPAAKRLALAAMVAAALALLALTSWAPPAAAHVEYESSDPSADAVLTTAPATVSVVFSGELLQEGSSLAVYGPDGARVDNGDATVDLNDVERRTLSVTLRPGLGDGLYTVEYAGMALDGHEPEPGRFTFEVSATGVSVASPAASPVASPEASPEASPAASPVASPEASPVAGLAGSTNAGGGDGPDLGVGLAAAVLGCTVVAGLAAAGVRRRRLATPAAG